MINRIGFRAESTVPTVKNQSSQEPEKERKSFWKNKTAMILTGLGVLAAGSIAFIAIKKTHPFNDSVVAEKPLCSDIKSYSEYLNDCISSLSEKENHSYEKFLIQHNYRYESSLSDKTPLQMLYKGLSLKSVKDDTIIPSVINITGADDNIAPLLTKVLGRNLEIQCAVRKYDTSYSDEFISMLKEETISSNASRLMYIQNSNAFIQDLEKTPGKLDTILRHTNENNLILVFNTDKNLQKTKPLDFEFISNKVPSYKEAYREGRPYGLFKLQENACSSISNVFPLSESTPFMQSVACESNDVPLLMSVTPPEAEMLANAAKTIENNRFAVIDGKDYAGNVNKFIEYLKENLKHYYITEEKTYLYMFNADELVKNPENYKLFSEMQEKYKTKPLILINKNINKNSNVFKSKEYKNFDVVSLAEQKAAKYKQLAENKEFEYLDKKEKEILINGSLYGILGINDDKGILLEGGTNEAGIKTIKTLAEIYDANFVKFNFDASSGEKCKNSLVDLLSVAEDSLKDYKKTGKQTFIYVENLDEMLTKYSTIEERRYLAIFKDIAESCNEDYKCTLSFQTNKNLGKFENASIAPHRFSTKVYLKNKE